MIVSDCNNCQWWKVTRRCCCPAGQQWSLLPPTGCAWVFKASSWQPCTSCTGGLPETTPSSTTWTTTFGMTHITTCIASLLTVRAATLSVLYVNAVVSKFWQPLFFTYLDFSDASYFQRCSRNGRHNVLLGFFSLTIDACFNVHCNNEEWKRHIFTMPYL